MSQKIYPRSNDKETVYLKSVITNPNIIVGDYTIFKFRYTPVTSFRYRKIPGKH